MAKIERAESIVTYTVTLTQDELDILTSVLGANCSNIGYDLYSAFDDAGGNGSAYSLQYDGQEIGYTLEKP